MHVAADAVRDPLHSVRIDEGRQDVSQAWQPKSTRCPWLQPLLTPWCFYDRMPAGRLPSILREGVTRMRWYTWLLRWFRSCCAHGRSAPSVVRVRIHRCGSSGHRSG
jgi:hypothetical protein